MEPTRPQRQRKPDSLDAAFAQSIEDRNLTGLRWVSAVGGGALLLFSPLDSVLLGSMESDSEFLTFFILRLIALTGQFGLFGLTYLPRCRRYMSWLCVASLLIVGMAIAMMVQLLGGFTSSYYAGLNLVLLASIFFALRPWQLGVTSLAIYGMYLLPSLWMHHLGLFEISGSNSSILFNNSLFILTTGAFVVAANALSHRLRRAQFEANHNLEDAHARLQGLDETKSRFFANISHELRTPLTLILSPVETLLESPKEKLGARTRAYLETMHSNAQRLLKLINDLLDLAKLDDGRLKLHLRALDLNKLLEHLVDAVRPLAQRKKVQLLFAGDTPVPISADPDRIEQVVLNLLANAVKFTPEGGRVELVLEVHADRITVRVRDTGIGIPQGQLELIFNRFAQVDDGPNREHGGTGIGLAVARELVELHGGRIWAESLVGQGSSFCFDLPRAGESLAALDISWPEQSAVQDTADSRMLEIELATVSAPQLETENEKGYSLATGTLLLVEDDPEILAMLARELAGDFRIVTARDGREGLEAALRARPDLIVSDVMMPWIGGFELCRQIKSHERLRHIPIILLTAKGDLDSKIEGFDVGADAYLPKPFNIQELKTRIRALLKSRAAQGGRVLQAHMSALAGFAAGLSHEINNPLVPLASGFRSLMMFFEMYRERVEASSAPDKRTKALVGRIESFGESVEVGIDRIQSLLQRVGKLATGVGNREMVVDLNGALDSTLALLRPRLPSGVEITCDLNPSVAVFGPVEGINQVLINLLKNAILAVSEEGTIEVSTRVDERGVQLVIRDSGMGIPPDVLPRIFDHFFSTRPEGEGQGLGLSIVHDIVTRMKGHIHVDSKPGEGTAFTIRWPLPKQEPVEAPHA